MSETTEITGVPEEDCYYANIEIAYRKLPKTSELLIEDTKWTKYIEDGLTLYHMSDYVGEAISLYMNCTMDTIPINNYIYYLNSDDEYTVYAYISYFKDGSNIYEISNDIYNGKLKLRRNFAFHIGEKQAMDIFYGANRINYRKLLFTDESMYSVSKINGATKLYKVIQNYLPSTYELVITDATANIGSDSVYMASKFSYVNAIEIYEKTFDVLRHNIDTLRIKNIGSVLGDCTKALSTTEQDVIIVDAPWGGRNYKDHTKMRLYLSGKEIHELYTMYKDKAKLFVFKVPCNYDIEFFTNKLAETGVSVDIYDYTKLDRKSGNTRCYYKFLAIINNN
jgi:hypothetical protein